MKKMFKDKIVLIAVLSAIANILLLWVIVQQVDIISAILYVFFALLVGLLYNAIVKKDKFSNMNIFLLGAGISLAYNMTGQFLGWFNAGLTLCVSAAVQQAFITLFVKWGYKK
jgi:predicted membrane channel-forming protein YqfA (hemolysin III family)